MGRKTYDKIIELAAEYPHKDKKNYVFSQKKSAGKRKEKEKDHNVEFIADIIDFVKIQLIQWQGKDTWLIGGADIISIFLNAGMLNEIILSIHPIVLGKGTSLFRNLQRQMNLKLVKTIPYDSGLVQLLMNSKSEYLQMIRLESDVKHTTAQPTVL
jgi:dihydrofolate reductase